MMRKSMKSSTIMIGSVFMPSLQGFATVKHEQMRKRKRKSVFFYKPYIYFTADQCNAIIFHANLF